MNLKLIKLQLFLLSFLSLIFVAEWGYGKFFAEDVNKKPVIVSAEDNTPITLPSIDSLNVDDKEDNEMVERPLFYEGRKPPAEPTSDNEQTVEISQLDDWQLVGIYNRDKQQMALFSKKNEPKTILKVSASALVSGWSLKEIQSDRVILWQSGQTKTILLRKPRADVPVPPVQRPAPNRPGLAPSNRPGVPRIAKPVMQPTPNSENASDDNKN